MRIILFGGSFDPIHNGHINIALNAMEQINADKVIFIINNKSKDKECVATINDRLAMLKLATSPYDNFEINEFELKNENNISYTIDTIKYFKEQHPNDELFFLVGSDQFDQIETWHQWEELINEIQFIVYQRDSKYNKKYNEIPISGEFFDISSTNIKNQNKWNDVPAIVNDYINENGIYYMERYKMFNISEKRLQHSLRVAKMCYNVMKKFYPELANIAWTSGVYHDVCKCESQEWLEDMAYNKYHFKKAVSWKVLHGPVGAKYLKEKLNFKNEIILNAITRHTQPLDECKKEALTIVDKLLYCCDKLEINRTDEDVENIDYYRTKLNENIDVCFDELLEAINKQYKD